MRTSSDWYNWIVFGTPMPDPEFPIVNKPEGVESE